MPTVQQIIDWVNRKYPNHGETSENLIIDLNDIHKEVFTDIYKDKNEREIWSFKTLVGIDSVTGESVFLPTYDLANDCTIELIDSVKVSTIPNPASPDDYETYEYAGLNDDISSG
jgi:hypothetical protein